MDQWRLRAAQYADETEAHVRAALLVAVPVEKGEPLPFPRGRDSIYYKHAADAHVYFVIEDHRETEGRYLLKTVINPENWHPSWRKGYTGPAKRVVDWTELPQELRDVLASNVKQSKAARRTIYKLNKYKTKYLDAPSVMADISSRIKEMNEIIECNDSTALLLTQANNETQHQCKRARYMRTPLEKYTANTARGILLVLGQDYRALAEGDPEREVVMDRFKAVAAHLEELEQRAQTTANGEPNDGTRMGGDGGAPAAVSAGPP